MDIDIEKMKASLQTILTAARLRREGIEAQELQPAPAAVEPKPEPQQPVEAPDYYIPPIPGYTSRDHREIREAMTPKPVEPVIEAEPLPDYSDGTWIEQREAELVYLTEPNGDNGEVITREVFSGRFISTWRQRTPADGAEAFVIIPPKSRMKPDEEKVEWPSWGQVGLVDPRVRRENSRRYSGPLDRRNVGVIRWNGEVEE